MTRSFARPAPLALLALTTAAACGGTEVVERRGTAVEHGEFLFGDKSASPSAANLYSCSTCHATGSGSTRILPGGTLGGVTERPTYWGGTVVDLLAAINTCRATFMDARVNWTDDDEDAKAMYGYLKSLDRTTTAAVPFTIVRDIADIATGDKGRGEDVYRRACLRCHGEARTGAGRLTAEVARLPEDTIAEHVGYSPGDLRLVFIEKVRHGPFLSYGGVMPPFSTETLPDADLADVLAFLGQ